MSKDLFFVENLTPVYQDVQLSEIFADSKFFVDCVAKYAASDILNKYDKAKDADDFDLKAFVTANFDFPKEHDVDYHSEGKPLREHLNTLWEVLKRTPKNEGGTLINLPLSYIVPGGRFREIYYWDSYFTMLGLKESKREDIIENMVDNFAYLIKEHGFIPNGNRTYYLGRSQPPFFALMVNLLAETQGNETLLKYKDALETEYHFWINGFDALTEDETTHRRVVKLPDGSLLNRYYDDKDTPRPEAFIEDVDIAKNAKRDPSVIYRNIRAAAESGWDFSSRWLADGKDMTTIQTTDLIPIDLNCLLLYLEETILRIYEILEDEIFIGVYKQKIACRKSAINLYCWNEDAGFYFDHNFVENQQTPLLTLASVYPLFFNVATQKQAEQVAQVIENQFLKDGGLATTIYQTGQQWDFPNGWAPLQWLAYKGLKNYGLNDLANKIKHNWLTNNEKVYAETGKMMEKYNVADVNIKAGGGEYPNQDGFGWTNGVYLKLKAEVD